MATLKSPNKQAEPAVKPSAGQRIAVILIRGMVGHTPDVKYTLNLLKLRKKNTCVVYPRTVSITGMLFRVKDFITWGDVDETTYALLVSKRGRKEQDNVFHLCPPRGGYGRKGIKQPFTRGGGLGDRGVKINDILKRMIP